MGRCVRALECLPRRTVIRPRWSCRWLQTLQTPSTWIELPRLRMRHKTTRRESRAGWNSIVAPRMLSLQAHRQSQRAVRVGFEHTLHRRQLRCMFRSSCCDLVSLWADRRAKKLLPAPTWQSYRVHFVEPSMQCHPICSVQATPARPKSASSWKNKRQVRRRRTMPNFSTPTQCDSRLARNHLAPLRHSSWIT